MKVWTEAYRPFILGGDVNAPIAADIEDTGPILDLGEGYCGYLLVNPATGDTFVAESTSGAFVGPSIEQVREDIATGSPALMCEQVDAAMERRHKAIMLPADEFWGVFKKRKKQHKMNGDE